MRADADGTWHLDLLAPDVHCAACIRRIEGAVRDVPGLDAARVNLTTRRIALKWTGTEALGDVLADRIAGLGFAIRPFDPEALAAAETDAGGDALLRAIAVSGFAAANVMLLSVSVWSGAEAATRDLFHWLSALIALPAVAYAGRPFYRSAYRAVSHGRLNMDVPISLAVVLAAAMSVFETINSGPHAYFDASVTLLFFLLIGRYLDHRMRARARSAAVRLLALQATAATMIDEDGKRIPVRINDLKQGDRIAIAAGDRIPADGLVVSGASDIDRAMVTGETVPEAVTIGALVHAGMLNLTGPLEVEVTAFADGTLLAEIVRLMETAEQGRARFVRIADRAARIYAPAVHLLALATLIGWLIVSGDLRTAMFATISVLVITCPCALGLAVPAVQVVAAGVLLRRGVMVKEGDALEKLARIDTVVFDKTGTLTEGRPRLRSDAHSGADLALAAGLARVSRHPLSRALVEAATALGIEPIAVSDPVERPGRGLEGRRSGNLVRLGRCEWCADIGVAAPDANGDDGLLEFWLAEEGRAPVRFAFEDAPRADAAAVVGALQDMGLEVRLLSGDRAGPVAQTAAAVGVTDARGGCEPGQKSEVLDQLAAEGRHVLMVGDGLNDAPALSGAFVSMSPTSAADVSQTSAGLVFTGQRLAPVVDAIVVARSADRLVKQNFALAIGYNTIAVPIAVIGLATPLIAAIAMSSSSLIVTANSLRLRLALRTPPTRSDKTAVARAETAPVAAG